LPYPTALTGKYGVGLGADRQARLCAFKGEFHAGDVGSDSYDEIG
jgi:hypothetical protein